jgi:hypothetical protein
MPTPPAQPKIYHITHVDNLPSIIREGGLRPDSTIIARGGPSTTIGMASIKQRRLTLPVDCHPGDHVGDYVPFYFCPRSVMLYLIHKANHPELPYKGGQGPIVHLEADMDAVVEWARSKGRRWAFSTSNAGTYYTQFRKSLAELSEINWPAVAAMDFRSSDVKEGKQAEFLLHGGFPWQLVSRIGIYSQGIAARAHAALDAALHRPIIEVRSDWYF